MDTTTLYIIIGVITLLVLYVIFTYNRLVSYENRSEEAWADIDVQLKRRYDLIPNLINTVKGYADHEQQTLQNVTEARTRAMNAGSTGEKQEAENMLSGALKSLFAVSENYPDLKASDNFKELQQELSDTENKIQAARRFYNTNVQKLQNAHESFPSNIIAGAFKFQKKEYFELDEADAAARQPVSVNF